MLKHLERRASYRGANEFLMIAHDVQEALHDVRPASVQRLSQAAFAIMHYVIHSDAHLLKRWGQWRIARALLAARAAYAILRRLHGIEAHRVIVSAAMEVLEREIAFLEAEVVP